MSDRDVTCVPDDYTAKLMAELTRVLDENARLWEELAKARDPQRIGGQADPSSFVYAIEQLREFRWQHATNDEDAIPYINNVAAAHERENAKLRDRITTQKQTIQAYRDESREWREVAEHAQAENDKLRELVRDMLYGVMWACAGQHCAHRHEGCFRVLDNHGDRCVSGRCWYEDRMSELVIEVTG